MAVAELLVVLAVGAVWVLAIAGAVWAVVTLHRIRVAQEGTRLKLEAIERLLLRD